MKWFTSRTGRVIAAGLALAFMTAGARAQGPARGPGGPGGPGGPMMFGGPSLLSSQEVLKDLELTDKQEAQVKRLSATLAQKRREAFEEGAGEGNNPMARMGAMMELQRNFDAAVTKSLNKRQKDRLAQLELQRAGKFAVERKEVAAKLKLTAAQNKKVKAAVDEMRVAMARTMPRPPGFGGPPGGGRPEGTEGRGGERRRDRDAGEGPGTQDAKPGEGPERRAEGAGGAGEGARPSGEEANGQPGGRRRGEGNRGGEGGPNANGGGPRRGGRPDFNSPEFRAAMAKMMEEQKKVRETAEKQIDEILTETQEAAFEKMLGKPFDFSKLVPPGGGPFGGGPPPAAAKSER